VAGDGELEVSAALLGRGRDIPDMVGNLADRLERAIPDHLVVERRPFRRHVKSLTVKLDPQWFRIDLHGHRALAWVDHVVRGVCVRSDDVTFDAWLDGLARALEAEALRSAEVRLALEDALR
jgi:hypothetical protein